MKKRTKLPRAHKEITEEAADTGEAPRPLPALQFNLCEEVVRGLEEVGDALRELSRRRHLRRRCAADGSVQGLGSPPSDIKFLNVMNCGHFTLRSFILKKQYRR